MVILNNSTVSGNIASNSGGGIYNSDLSQLLLNQSTVSENTAFNFGGGIKNNGTAILRNSTISGNQIDSRGGGISNGGLLTINNTTIVDNHSGGVGGGIDNYLWGPGVVDIQNSIIAKNTATNSGPDCTGILTSHDYNLIQDTADCVISGTTTNVITGTDPLVGLLEDNYGVTKSYALLAGSPAIDRGNPDIPGSSNNSCEAIDQRDVDRPVDGDQDGFSRCDIGAFEFAYILVEKTSNLDNAGIGQAITYTYLVKNIGTITLTDILANDDHLGNVDLGVTSLTAGEVATGALQHTVVTTDPSGWLTNTVIVTGILESPPGLLVSDTDNVSVNLLSVGTYLPVIFKNRVN
jgi:hypothetical protein